MNDQLDPGNLVRGLRSQIADQLRRELLLGQFKEGEPIRQQELVARFGVSRTPVREALIQLANEGLLVNTPNRGVTVAVRPPDSVRDFLAPLRSTIEVYALRLCFDRIGEADLAQWERIVEGMRAACASENLAALADRELAFHRLVIERSGEPVLSSIWSMIVSQVASYFHDEYTRYADLMDVYREHREILDQIRSGDKEAAIAAYAAGIEGTPVVASSSGAAPPAEEASTRKARAKARRA